ncbi:hypothetical protein DL769_008963 [Monosporascus sp. CRB-8-3]|nr:hypothetical protein DL769_008963 [Monosporascus sp. CRB-8-3]
MLGFTSDFRNPESSSAAPRSVSLHAYVSSRILHTAAAGTRPAAGPTGSEEANGVVGICAAATLLDGVVLALTPDHHSCNYRSAVVFGRAHMVTDEAEPLWAMERVTDDLIPGRWAATRYLNAAEPRSTGILRVDVGSASAKIRTRSTGEAPSDLNDEDIRQRVREGVVPAHLVWGEPMVAPTNTTDEVPRYIDERMTEETEEANGYAYHVTK